MAAVRAVEQQQGSAVPVPDPRAQKGGLRVELFIVDQRIELKAAEQRGKVILALLPAQPVVIGAVKIHQAATPLPVESCQEPMAAGGGIDAAQGLISHRARVGKIDLGGQMEISRRSGKQDRLDA